MYRVFAVVSVIVWLAAFPVRAALPDDRYVAILYLIQQGDTAESAGAKSEAFARYTSAFTALQQLQHDAPQWETGIVSYRLGYLRKRLDVLGAERPPVATAPQPAASVANAAPDAEAILQAQLKQSQADIDLLQAKLREALAARPASLDPAQLAAAEDRVRQLSKENELLKLSSSPASAGSDAAGKEITRLRKDLEETNRKLSAESSRVASLSREKGDLVDRLGKSMSSPADSGGNRSAQRKLEEATRKLDEQQAAASILQREKKALIARLNAAEAGAAAAAALRAENELLKRQVAGARSSASPGEIEGRLGSAQAQIVLLQSECDVLRLERGALEGRLKQLQSTAKTAAPAAESSRSVDEKRIKQLEQERDSLQRQLAVYEFKAIPYTAEELALLRQTPPGLLAADPAARKTSAPPRPPVGTSTLVAEAQRFYARGDYSRAEERYQQVLRKDDRNVYTLANLASIQIEAGKLDEAEKNLSQAMAIAPDDSYSLQLLGSLKLRQNNLDAAVDMLTRAARLDPENPEILNILGVTLNHKGQRAAAENALRRALLIDPGYGNAHNNLAVVYASQTPPCIELAKMHYQRALSSGYPRNPELEKMLAQKTAPVGATVVQ